jgi:hypothetical protein
MPKFQFVSNGNGKTQLPSNVFRHVTVGADSQ